MRVGKRRYEEEAQQGMVEARGSGGWRNADADEKFLSENVLKRLETKSVLSGVSKKCE